MTQMNLSMTQNKIRDIENRLVIAKVEGGGRGKTWKFGISRCKLVYIPPPQPSWPSAASYLAPGFGPACAPGLASPTPRSPSAFSSPFLSSAAAALPGSAHPGQLPDQGPGGNLALAAASGVHSPTPRHVIKNRPYFPGLQWLSSDPTTALRNPRCGALSSNPAL